MECSGEARFTNACDTLMYTNEDTVCIHTWMITFIHTSHDENSLVTEISVKFNDR